MNDNSIEVIGEASFDLKAVLYRMGISLEARATESKLGKSVKDDTVRSAEYETVMTHLLNRLIEQGFPESQIVHGGTRDQSRWQYQKGSISVRSSRLDLHHADATVFMMVPIWLADLETKRLKFRYHKGETDFEDPAKPSALASAEALVNARRSADAIASAAGREISRLVSAQDLRLASKTSDYSDYPMPVSARMRSPSPSPLEEFELGEETMTSSISYRVRFELS